MEREPKRRRTEDDYFSDYSSDAHTSHRYSNRGTRHGNTSRWHNQDGRDDYSEHHDSSRYRGRGGLDRPWTDYTSRHRWRESPPPDCFRSDRISFREPSSLFRPTRGSPPRFHKERSRDDFPYRTGQSSPPRRESLAHSADVSSETSYRLGSTLSSDAGTPKGPKSRFTQFRFPPVNRTLRMLPHLFISSNYVPCNPKTIPHIHGRMHHMQEVDEFRIELDNSGYFIFCGSGSRARDSLSLCYSKYHRANLFNYIMHMEKFLDGVEDPEPRQPMSSSVQTNRRWDMPSTRPREHQAQRTSPSTLARRPSRSQEEQSKPPEQTVNSESHLDPIELECPFLSDVESAPSVGQAEPSASIEGQFQSKPRHSSSPDHSDYAGSESMEHPSRRLEDPLFRTTQAPQPNLQAEASVDMNPALDTIQEESASNEIPAQRWPFGLADQIRSTHPKRARKTASGAQMFFVSSEQLKRRSLDRKIGTAGVADANELGATDQPRKNAHQETQQRPLTRQASSAPGEFPLHASPELYREPEERLVLPFQGASHQHAEQDTAAPENPSQVYTDQQDEQDESDPSRLGTTVKSLNNGIDSRNPGNTAEEPISIPSTPGNPEEHSTPEPGEKPTAGKDTEIEKAAEAARTPVGGSSSRPALAVSAGSDAVSLALQPPLPPTQAMVVGLGLVQGPSTGMTNREVVNWARTIWPAEAFPGKTQKWARNFAALLTSHADFVKVVPEVQIGPWRYRTKPSARQKYIDQYRIYFGCDPPEGRDAAAVSMEASTTDSRVARKGGHQADVPEKREIKPFSHQAPAFSLIDSRNAGATSSPRILTPAGSPQTSSRNPPTTESVFNRRELEESNPDPELLSHRNTASPSFLPWELSDEDEDEDDADPTEDGPTSTNEIRKEGLSKRRARKSDQPIPEKRLPFSSPPPSYRSGTARSSLTPAISDFNLDMTPKLSPLPDTMQPPSSHLPAVSTATPSSTSTPAAGSRRHAGAAALSTEDADSDAMDLDLPTSTGAEARCQQSNARDSSDDLIEADHYNPCDDPDYEPITGGNEPEIVSNIPEPSAAETLRLWEEMRKPGFGYRADRPGLDRRHLEQPADIAGNRERAKKRPNRKVGLGTLRQADWIAPRGPKPQERNVRTAGDRSIPDASAAAEAVLCGTMEEFCGMLDNMKPIKYNGELAYIDMDRDHEAFQTRGRLKNVYRLP